MDHETFEKSINERPISSNKKGRQQRDCDRGKRRGYLLVDLSLFMVNQQLSYLSLFFDVGLYNFQTYNSLSAYNMSDNQTYTSIDISFVGLYNYQTYTSLPTSILIIIINDSKPLRGHNPKNNRRRPLFLKQSTAPGNKRNVRTGRCSFWSNRSSVLSCSDVGVCQG